MVIIVKSANATKLAHREATKELYLNVPYLGMTLCTLYIVVHTNLQKYKGE